MSEQQAVELQRRCWTLQSQGRLAEAAEAAREALRLLRAVDSLPSMEVADVLTDLAEIEHLFGNHAAARMLAERAQRIEEAFGPPFLDATAARIRIRTLFVLSLTYRADGEFLHAELLLKEALTVALNEFAAVSEEVAIVENELAVLYRCWHKADMAQRWYERALSTMAALQSEARGTRRAS